MRIPVKQRVWPALFRVIRLLTSGGGGIRTHGQAEPVNGFQDRPDQPLWHPSGSSDKMANGRWQMADGRWQMADGRWQMAEANGSAASGRTAGARVVHWPTSSMMSSAT